MIKTLNTLFVTMFGLGKIPKIPGTFGSLVTIIILYLFFHILNLPSNLTGLNENQINLKGKTVEKLGLIGKEKAIACETIISITKYD